MLHYSRSVEKKAPVQQERGSIYHALGISALPAHVQVAATSCGDSQCVSELFAALSDAETAGFA